MKLEECEQRIRRLEDELEQSQRAHAYERETRKSLEIEREKMKAVLERMGNGLRSLAVQIHPSVDASIASSNMVLVSTFHYKSC